MMMLFYKRFLYIKDELNKVFQVSDFLLRGFTICGCHVILKTSVCQTVSKLANKSSKNRKKNVKEI